MSDAFGKVVAILLICIMLFVIPIKFYMDKNTAMEEMYIISRTVELVDSVRNTGFITKDMLETYEKQVCTRKHLYNIEMTHKKIGYINYEKISDEYYSSQIMEQLLSDKIYYFDKEDYFCINVTEKKGNNVIAYYGGYIKNEAY